METSTLLSQNGIIDRAQLALVPTPQGTATHRPIPHHEVVQALIETLGFRRLTHGGTSHVHHHDSEAPL